MKKKSIIVRIRGGLGNQLFIYAMARRLAIKNDVVLQLDIVSGFRKDNYHRRYLLNNFNIKDEIATSYDSYETRFGLLRRKVWIIMEQFRELYNRFYILEEKRSFEPQIINLKIRKNIYLDGLWHSEHYFKDVENIIRQDFEISCHHDTDTIKMADKIKNANAVSLHWRSYSEVPSKDGSPALSPEYYYRAIDLLAQHIDNPHFFCFSDDPDWLKTNLTSKFPMTYVRHDPAHEDENTINDLWLMSQCKHHIIANSTFSWWGAWLNNSPDKIVIAPRCEWLNPDYYPNSWIIL